MLLHRHHNAGGSISTTPTVPKKKFLTTACFCAAHCTKAYIERALTKFLPRDILKPYDVKINVCEMRNSITFRNIADLNPISNGYIHPHQ